ncbi:MAG: AmmeMemoRadiSam system protein A [Candidatus Aminicenantes bacterium]|nr:MAG: AmmeMemoRadiSam system protein A [Candidatus Aminicenantes bacterium]
MDTSLTRDQEKSLLRLARLAITLYLKEGSTPAMETDDATFRIKRGAFVTLKVKDQLRGCIGYPTPHKPLFETIIDVAVSAATKDFRFPSLEQKELNDTKIEISVLSQPKLIKDIAEIEVGKHGIIITKGPHKGLLLPQVPIEWGWDRETFLSHGCMKAGIEEDAWKKDTQIEIFTAQVFSE